MSGPLDGIVAIDLARVLAGPGTCRLMAEMGARVIKVEPPAGETSRTLPYVRDGRSGYYIQQNRGKESVCLDLRSAEGMAVLRDLLAHADVLVENYRPGVLASMGLGWEQLEEDFPQLILCSVSALGYDGPLSERAGYDTIGAALSGIASVSGPPGGPPRMPGAAIGDTMTSAYGFGGVMTALFNRTRTGKGDWVKVSLLDSYMSCHEINVQSYSGSGGTVEPGKAGSLQLCPVGIFGAKQAYVYMSCVHESDWGRLAAAMGVPQLADHPDYETHASRAARAGEVNQMFIDWMDSFDDLEDALDLLVEHNVPHGRILTVPQAMEHPHNLARRVLRTVPDDRWGEITLPGVPIRIESVVEADLRAEDLGQSSERVLAELLAYDAERIEALVSSGAVRVPAAD